MPLLVFFFGNTHSMMFILLQIDINCLKHIVKQLGSQLEKLWLANCSRVTGTHILPLIQVF